MRLLLVDDHAVVRGGLRMLLGAQPDMEIVGEAETGAQAVQLAQELQPDVVLMDIALPDFSGIEATRRLKAGAPHTAVVALTMHEDEEYFFQMLMAGAAGYVPKRAAPEDLLSAVRAAASGMVYLYPSLARALVRDYVARPEGERDREALDDLTTREQEVLAHLADGASNEQIADVLTISPNTVARHRENIMRKLNLHTRAELVKYAIRRGIIEA